MDSWENRPVEVANLLNPAFCGELLHFTITSYYAQSQRNFPFSLSYLVLPIILHSNTRKRIPLKKDMFSWIEENPDMKIGFSDRVKSLIPFSQEALLFLIQTNFANIDNLGNLYVVNPLNEKKYKSIGSDEITDCIKKSVIIGRKLASAGSVPVIYAMWGIKP
jgi:hypothetical protein